MDRQIDGGLTSEQNGLTHGFVLEFESRADRDYFVKKDPVHQAFVKTLDGMVEKTVVLDFSGGVV